MAWLKHIDKARDHLAIVLEDVSRSLDEKSRSDAPITDEERAFREALRVTINRMSVELFVNAVPMELLIKAEDYSKRPRSYTPTSLRKGV